MKAENLSKKARRELIEETLLDIADLEAKKQAASTQMLRNLYTGQIETRRQVLKNLNEEDEKAN
jgi:hypothetical protein